MMEQPTTTTTMNDGPRAFPSSDENGGGGPPQYMEKQKSVTMEYYLKTTDLDEHTISLLRKYDQDGNGSFSKDEVVAIILDLRESTKSNEALSQSNIFFRRLLIAACIFCIFLLAAMFGLSYAVAALTAKTTVNSDNVLVVANTNSNSNDKVVSTNARADIHNAVRDSNGNVCLTPSEVNAMMLEVTAGRNVLLEIQDDENNGGGNDSSNSLALTQLSGAGLFIEESAGRYCFLRPSDGSPMCYVYDPACNESNTSGRKLTESQHDELIASYGHHHSHGLGRSLSMSHRRHLTDTGGLNLVTGQYYCKTGSTYNVEATCNPADTNFCKNLFGGGAKCVIY